MLGDGPERAEGRVEGGRALGLVLFVIGGGFVWVLCRAPVKGQSS